AVVDAVHGAAVPGHQRLAQRLRLRGAVVAEHLARGDCAVECVEPGTVEQGEGLPGGRADEDVEQFAVHGGVAWNEPVEYGFGPGTDQMSAAAARPLVGVVMGSRSDWDTMQHASARLDALGIAHEVRVVSAHRTPDVLFEYAATAEARGLRAIIAGAGGAAHLPGMLAAKTTVPVLGVPVQSKALNGLDSLLSIVQMPGGIPVATF